MKEQTDAQFKKFKEGSQKDAYFIGLLANALFSSGRESETNELIEQLVEYQQKDGSIIDGKFVFF